MSISNSYVSVPDWRTTLLYIVALAGMCVTSYAHLDFAADGIQNVTWSILLGMFPIFLVFVSILMLIGSVINSRRQPIFAARIAWWACVIALPYYAIMMCGLAAGFALGILATPQGLLFFVLPASCLVATLVHTQGIIKPPAEMPTKTRTG